MGSLEFILLSTQIKAITSRLRTISSFSRFAYYFTLDEREVSLYAIIPSLDDDCVGSKTKHLLKQSM